jgi:hypothetical protein
MFKKMDIEHELTLHWKLAYLEEGIPRWGLE